MYYNQRYRFNFFSYSFNLFLWCLFAFLFSLTADQETIQYIASLMHAACKSPMSIVSSFLAIFPFLFLSVTLHFRKLLWAYLYFFFKFLLIGLMVQAISLAFPSGNWIVYGFLMTPHLINLFLSILFFLRESKKQNYRLNRGVLIYILISFLVWTADYVFLSPFLVSLFHS